MYYRIFFPIYQWAAQKMCFHCQDFIPKGGKILDLGCGSGIVAKAFQDFFQAKVVGVDIEDRRIFYIPFEIIDGKILPFPEKSFDAALINYVLHHSEDPEALLREAKRVARKIIIYEDLPEDLLSKVYCKFHNLTFNKFFQKPSEAKPSEGGDESKLRKRQTSATNNNTSFKTGKEWEEIFQKTGLTIIFKKKINNFPVKKELYVLGV